MNDDVENSTLPTARTPLLPSEHAGLTSLSHGWDYIGRHIPEVSGEESWVWTTRHRLQQFLSSKWGHYTVIILVSLDVAGIFADFLISLHICEHAGEKGFHQKQWERVDEVLDIISLVFSCLFMLELLCSIWAFGLELRIPDDPPIVVTLPWATNTDIHLSRYFNSKFHIFDATVILAGFVVDVLLHGTIQEAGSLVVVGRLWRVFKIIEEFSSGAQEQIEGLQERIEDLEKENETCRRENEDLKQRINKADVPA
jgi:hypothetical protein